MSLLSVRTCPQIDICCLCQLLKFMPWQYNPQTSKLGFPKKFKNPLLLLKMEYEGGFISGSQFHSPRGSLDCSLGARTILWTLSWQIFSRQIFPQIWEIKAIKYLGRMQEDAGAAEICMGPFGTGVHFWAQITKSCFLILFVRFSSNAGENEEHQ